ncbi:substrate-binding domain-containing protein [Gaetbulibacter saemankumensis]|uniref:substrate-binding domain-containing protein n=1 Tax=Gaetbulibacter saemankumensis TaxID=311208 RepID=UPI0003FB7404|nr:substrate-binding domain-containing protein [Gaetbulibacter saemankumensis]
MKQVNIGGVPEHFNLPWYMGLKNGAYKNQGINLRWKDYYGGTGDMSQALRKKEIDIAVILTEGIIKDIISGNPSKIVQTYVQTPLNWGIHVAYHSKYKTIQDLKGSRAAISRFGSGSHLMAYINAKNSQWDLDKDLNFEVIKNLNGAVDGLTNRKADYFMWEKFTTKPLVDNKTFRRIGNCPSPWPCFVIAAHQDFIDSHPDTLKSILNIINNTTSNFKKLPNIAETIAARYEQKLDDVQEWLSITEWSQSLIDQDTVIKTQSELYALNIIPELVSYDALVYKL